MSSLLNGGPRKYQENHGREKSTDAAPREKCAAHGKEEGVVRSDAASTSPAAEPQSNTDKQRGGVSEKDRPDKGSSPTEDQFHFGSRVLLIEFDVFLPVTRPFYSRLILFAALLASLLSQEHLR